jgi:hypothetical protein
LLEQALTDERRIVFISGEPGIGKTTLVDAFLHTLDPSLHISRGQCIEQYGPARLRQNWPGTLNTGVTSPALCTIDARPGTTPGGGTGIAKRSSTSGAR